MSRVGGPGKTSTGWAAQRRRAAGEVAEPVIEAAENGAEGQGRLPAARPAQERDPSQSHDQQPRKY